ncbi:MAG: sulfate permease [Rhodobacteraceae bacterium]|nr:MAG: sulfate permease [Paracoccaceae bacterium]
MRRRARDFLPILDWGARYSRATLTADLTAALIVTIMLIPQSLAYALLAGLPPEVGLYASVAPLLLYGVFGTSRALAVGPVAVISLMTAAAAGQVATAGTAEHWAAALALALMSGLMLIAMGALRLGFLANFLSHPVISGFVMASGVIIAASQLKHLMGVQAGGHDLATLAASLWRAAPETNLSTLVLGLSALAFLWIVRSRLRGWLLALGLPAAVATGVVRAGPVLAVLGTGAAAWAFDLSARGVALVGATPGGLPPLTLPGFDPGLWSALALSALLISVVGFVESVSVAQTLAAKKRERIAPDQELIGLGAANVGAAFTGGMPVTGGFARSAVNFDAGAATPAAGMFTAGGIALATLFLTPWLAFLPVATLAATIIVAVLGLVDLGALRRTWVYSKADFSAQAATIATTLLFGVETGIATGVVLSIALHLNRTAAPHAAIVGQVPGTEHFRNVRRHHVVTDPSIVTIRIDESLYFPNARFLEDIVHAEAADPAVKHVVLMCPAVNFIDASALESLEAINQRLDAAGVRLHLSEVKGPVMDRLMRTHFLDALTGQVFLTQFDAFRALAPELAQRTLAADRRDTRRGAAA